MTALLVCGTQVPRGTYCAGTSGGTFSSTQTETPALLCGDSNPSTSSHEGCAPEVQQLLELESIEDAMQVK